MHHLQYLVFVLGVLPQAMRLCGMRGLLRTKGKASTFLVSFLTLELLVLVPSGDEDSHPPDTDQSSKVAELFLSTRGIWSGLALYPASTSGLGLWGLASPDLPQTVTLSWSAPHEVHDTNRSVLHEASASTGCLSGQTSRHGKASRGSATDRNDATVLHIPFLNTTLIIGSSAVTTKSPQKRRASSCVYVAKRLRGNVSSIEYKTPATPPFEPALGGRGGIRRGLEHFAASFNNGSILLDFHV